MSKVLREAKQWWCVNPCRGYYSLQKAMYSGIIHSGMMFTVRWSVQISMRNDGLYTAWVRVLMWSRMSGQAAVQPRSTNLFVVDLMERVILFLSQQGFELPNSSYIHTSLDLAWCFSFIRSRGLLSQTLWGSYCYNLDISTNCLRAGELNCGVGILMEH